MPIRTGRSVLTLPSRPCATGFAAVAGKKEGEGPLGSGFDFIYEDTTLGEKSWEKAESYMLRDAVQRALDKASLSPSDADMIFAGDLLDQCIGSTFGLREMNIPFAGVYGACSTMALSCAMAAVFADSGACGAGVAATSSHFCSAERQFRFPLEYGGQRPPTAQWTVTGAGAMVVETDPGNFNGIRIEQVIFGRIRDLGVKDAANMGAAMAPAAADTIARFLEDTNTTPGDYDIILTGDLGTVGSGLLIKLLKTENGVDISKEHRDCGVMIYGGAQDAHAGGSGCGCSASVLCSNILTDMLAGKFKKVLFAATGALMSPVSSNQGESIPGVAHGVLFSV